MDVYQTITDRILATLETGTIPWRQPWKAEASVNVPSNFHTGKSYRGVNIWLLLCSSYQRNQWLTYKQAKEIGAQVRKGEQGAPIVFWKFPVRGAEGVVDPEDKRGPLMRTYTVFNVAQCDGIPESLPFDVPSFEPIPVADAAAHRYLTCGNAPTLTHDGDRAFYSPTQDAVTMPHPGTFADPEGYYSTLFHEFAHSTGHASRLDRKLDNHHGDHAYSKEELIAEFTAAFLCAETGISNDRLEVNQSAYIQSWMHSLRNDKMLAVSAAQRAQKAADLILGRVVAPVAEA